MAAKEANVSLRREPCMGTKTSVPNRDRIMDLPPCRDGCSRTTALPSGVNETEREGETAGQRRTHWMGHEGPNGTWQRNGKQKLCLLNSDNVRMYLTYDSSSGVQPRHPACEREPSNQVTDIALDRSRVRHGCVVLSNPHREVHCTAIVCLRSTP